MLEKLGKRAFAIPIVLLILLGCFFSLIFYPMAHLEIKNIPFAITSLDEGVNTSEGTVNIGSLFVENISQGTSNDSESSPIQWQPYDSQEAVDAALQSNDVFGAIVIPSDFSQKQYDQLVTTLNDQVEELQSSLSENMPSPASSLSSLSASTTSNNPELSPQALAMIQAAQQIAAKATTDAQSSTQSFQDIQQSILILEQQITAAQAAVADMQACLDSASEEKTRLQNLIDEGTATDDERIQYEELSALIPQYEEQLTTAQNNLQSLTTEVEKEISNAENAQANLANAQANLQTASANAIAVQQTASTSALLASQASAMTQAIASIQDTLGSLSFSDQFSNMSETVAARSMSSIAETIEEGTNNEENTDSAKILVYLNVAKSPLIANTLESTLQLMFAQAGLDAQIVKINEGVMASDESDTSQTNPMSTMIAQQIAIIPVVVVSCIAGLIVSRLFKISDKTTRKQRFQCVLQQLLYSILFSLLVSLTAFAMLTYVSEVHAPALESILYMWICSLSLMTIITGLANIAFGLGVLTFACTVAFGMMLGVLPYEALPAFWCDWVYPWAPQRFFGEGIRAILYLGEGAWNCGSNILAPIGLAGIAISILSLFKPTKKIKLPFRVSRAANDQ